MSIWFTADTHFGHKNIMEYSGRPFDSVAEHDEKLIANWNECVRPGDTVYFLGDFAFKNKESALAIRRRLNGNIHFIVGNHDAAAHQIRGKFTWFKDVHEIKVGEQSIFLSHYAHRVWNKSHYGAWHLYGHSHNSLPELETSRSFDVGVDSAAAFASGVPSGAFIVKGQTRPQDYRPFSYDQVAARMATKRFVTVGHHGK